jgi:NADPH:quinone reductase-like Zn-dependent oxidoreductase
MTVEQAAAMPVAAITALQGVRDQGGVRAGQRVLVNGASGGVGTYAVQIAKALGATVTGVSSARNTELVRSLGADHVIDYTTANFTEDTTRYDVIIDNVGNHPLGALSRVLTPAGKYVMIGGPSGGWVDPLPRVIATLVRSKFSDRTWRFFIAEVTSPDLSYLAELASQGRLRSAIDRRYPFAEAPEAVRYVETGRARGKVVVVRD